MTADDQNMRKLFVGNFDFEHSLSGIGGGDLPQSVRRINDELATVWLAAAEDGDLIWTPNAVEEDFFEQVAKLGLPAVRPVTDTAQVTERVMLWPWGWTDSLRDWARQHGWAYLAPPQPAVRQVNSRRFSCQLEAEWKFGPDGAAELRSLQELTSALRILPESTDRWVLKAEFSMSARERWLGQGRELTDQAANWARRRLVRDGMLFLEPWLDRIEEAGLQFTIRADGGPIFNGLTPLLTDSSGEYRGSRFDAQADLTPGWRSAVEIGLRVAARAARAGYVGPLGIDAVRYRDVDGRVRLRPIQDINARMTMGRLSLGFRRLLSAGERGSWLLVRPPSDSHESPRQWFEHVSEQSPSDVRLIRTSPFVVGGVEVRHLTVIVIAATDASLDAAVTLLLNRAD